MEEKNKCGFVIEKMFFCVLFAIFMFGYYYWAQVKHPNSSQISDSNSQLNHTQEDVVITYSMQIPFENEKIPILECRMGLDAECSPFANAFVNFIYQDTAKLTLLLRTIDKDWGIDSKSGTIKICSNGLNYTTEIKMTRRNFKLPFPINSNIETNGEGVQKCNTSFNPEKQKCPEHVKEIIRQWEVISGIHSFNKSWNFVTTEVDLLSGTGIMHADFKKDWTITEMKDNFIQYETSRKLMCQCQNDNKDMPTRVGYRFIPATFGEIIRKCFNEHKIKTDFRPFLNPPSCFGEKPYQ